MSVWHRIFSMVGLPRQSAPSVEAGAAAMLQVSHQTTGEVFDGVPSMQIYGFASATLSGCDHAVIHAEGDRTKGVAIASNDQRYRPRGMLAGETKQYDNAGQFVYLTGGTKIVLNAVSEIDLEIGGVLVGKITNAGLMITGSIMATGDIIAGMGGGQVSLLHHVQANGGGEGDSGPPVPGS